MQMSWARSVATTVSWSSGWTSAHQGGPAAQVVGEHGAGQPGAVGAEVARGAVRKPGALFDVTDGELDGGMLAVEPVHFDRQSRPGR